MGGMGSLKRQLLLQRTHTSVPSSPSVDLSVERPTRCSRTASSTWPDPPWRTSWPQWAECGAPAESRTAGTAPHHRRRVDVGTDGVLTEFSEHVLPTLREVPVHEDLGGVEVGSGGRDAGV